MRQFVARTFLAFTSIFAGPLSHAADDSPVVGLNITANLEEGEYHAFFCREGHENYTGTYTLQLKTKQVVIPICINSGEDYVGRIQVTDKTQELCVQQLDGKCDQETGICETYELPPKCFSSARSL